MQDIGVCPGTPNCSGTRSLPGESRATSCPGVLRSPEARDSEGEPVVCLPARPPTSGCSWLSMRAGSPGTSLRRGRGCKALCRLPRGVAGQEAYLRHPRPPALLQMPVVATPVGREHCSAHRWLEKRRTVASAPSPWPGGVPGRAGAALRPPGSWASLCCHPSPSLPASNLCIVPLSYCSLALEDTIGTNMCITVLYLSILKAVTKQ